MIQEIRRYAWILADLHLIFLYLKHQFIYFCQSFVQIIILSRTFRASEISPSQGGNDVSIKAKFGGLKDKVEANYRQKTSICSWNREVFVNNDNCICLNLRHSNQYCWGHIFIFHLVHRCMATVSCVCISRLHNIHALQWADALSQDAYQLSIEKIHKVRKWETLAKFGHPCSSAFHQTLYLLNPYPTNVENRVSS